MCYQTGAEPLIKGKIQLVVLGKKGTERINTPTLLAFSLLSCPLHSLTSLHMTKPTHGHWWAESSYKINRRKEVSILRDRAGWRRVDGDWSRGANGKYLASINYSKSKALVKILGKHFAFIQMHKHTLKHFFKVMPKLFFFFFGNALIFLVTI